MNGQGAMPPMNQVTNLKPTMERKVEKQSHRTQTEVRFVRNLELLHDDELRLVMRDKLAPLMVGGDDSLLSNAFASVRLGHSDEALAVMFEVEAAHSAGTMSAVFKVQDKTCSVELSSDGQKIWTEGISEEQEVRHFGLADSKRWIHLIVIPFANIDLCNNSKAVEAHFTVSVVDDLASSKQSYSSLAMTCIADFV